MLTKCDRHTKNEKKTAAPCTLISNLRCGAILGADRSALHHLRYRQAQRVVDCSALRCLRYYTAPLSSVGGGLLRITLSEVLCCTAEFWWLTVPQLRYTAPPSSYSGGSLFRITSPEVLFCTAQLYSW